MDIRGSSSFMHKIVVSETEVEAELSQISHFDYGIQLIIATLSDKSDITELSAIARQYSESSQPSCQLPHQVQHAIIIVHTHH